MHRMFASAAIVCAASWLASSVAVAQVTAQYNPGPSRIREYYNQTGNQAPAVSPYVNLGVTQNGLSNYQTLVKPMIDDRAALRAQAINLQQARQPMRDLRAVPADRAAQGEANPRRGDVRFLHYSHYYPTPE